MEWDSFSRWAWADAKYLPARGEGETMATQAVTAIAKLVYKWYNDGDVYDNTHYMDGWCNDLSSYANWLRRYVPGADGILDGISKCCLYDEYEALLYNLCEMVETEEYLAELNERPKVGSIYDCDGPYKFVENDDDEDAWC